MNLCYSPWKNLLVKISSYSENGSIYNLIFKSRDCFINISYTIQRCLTILLTFLWQCRKFLNIVKIKRLFYKYILYDSKVSHNTFDFPVTMQEVLKYCEKPIHAPLLQTATLPWWRGLCVSMILRTQPAEACEPLAGTTKPERSKERNQTKRQSAFVVMRELVIFDATLSFFRL